MRLLFAAFVALVFASSPVLANGNQELCSDLVVIQAQKDNVDLLGKCLFSPPEYLPEIVEISARSVSVPESVEFIKSAACDGIIRQQDWKRFVRECVVPVWIVHVPLPRPRP